MAARNEHACDTTPLFTSPTNFRQTRAVHFPTRTAASPQGLGGFAALYPNCRKQKKLSCVYDMRHNFAFFLLFYFASPHAQKCKDNALPQAEAGRSRTTTQKRYLLTTLGILFTQNSRREASLGGSAAKPGVRLFD
jgi:hypothetical protein